jgi:hypothetical protein
MYGEISELHNNFTYSGAVCRQTYGHKKKKKSKQFYFKTIWCISQIEQVVIFVLAEGQVCHIL